MSLADFHTNLLASQTNQPGLCIFEASVGLYPTLTIDGLWALRFGNDHSAGLAETLFFTAGINGEKDGLFGTLTPIGPELGEDDEQ